MADALRDVADVERILSRLSAGSATGRDLGALRRTLRRLPEDPLVDEHSGIIAVAGTPVETPGATGSPRRMPWSPSLNRPSPREPPLRLTDGGIIRDGYSAPLDELRALGASSGRSWVSTLEAQERGGRTGIPSLKVGYNSVFGYFLEVSKANIAKVPGEWIRKQTLANGERFLTAELKELEDKILKAEERIVGIEKQLPGRPGADPGLFGAAEHQSRPDRRAGRARRRRRAGPAPGLRAPGNKRRHRHPHPGGPPPGRGGRLRPRLHSQRSEHLFG